MDYTKSNKEAWEEAFEKRSENWGKNRKTLFENEAYPYLEKEFVEILKGEDLTGKTVAQFCCNDGREILSITRLGAKKGFGFDIAENMIASAKEDAKLLGINCEFIATDILEIDEVKFKEQFDYVFMMIGAVTWFKDLGVLFKKVTTCLKPGGKFVLHEIHPVTNMLAAQGEDNFDAKYPNLLSNSYFRTEPWIESSGMGYMCEASYESKTFYSYSHTLEAILTAIIENGLTLKTFKEYEKDLSEMFVLLDHTGIPLSYIVVANK